MSKKLLDISHNVKEICLPFFKKFELDHFNYIYKDNNGKVTYLCSNHKWLEHYLSKSYFKVGAFENKSNLSNHKYILWNGLDKNDPILIDSKELIGVEYGITIIKKEKEGYEYYNLGKKTNNPTIINTYINNIQNYENFILEFQEKASNTLKIAKKLKFSIDNESLIAQDRLYRRYFGDIYLTNRELQCVNYLIRGKTAEEISIILNISKRTIETHIENLKRKFNCYNQFSLGYLIGQLGIT